MTSAAPTRRAENVILGFHTDLHVLKLRRGSLSCSPRPPNFIEPRRFEYSRLFAVAREQAIRIAPADYLHEGIDVGRGLGAIVDVIGVLLHKLARAPYGRCRAIL